MGTTNKVSSLILTIILVASSLLLLPLANAQSINKPSAPEFTLRIADHSYDVPPTTTSYTDPYTGKTTTSTQPGYHVTNRTIEVKIKNQPFTPYVDADGNSINLYYNISVKPHYGGNWIYYPNSYGETYPASNSEYTIREFGFGGYADTVSPQIGYVKPGGEVDFRVQMQIGYYKNVWISIGDSPFAGGLVPTFFGENSQWSNAETIIIPDGSVTTSTPNPTSTSNFTPTTSPTPTITPIATDTNGDSANLITLPLEIFVIIVAVVVLLAMALSVLFFRRHRKPVT